MVCCRYGSQLVADNEMEGGDLGVVCTLFCLGFKIKPYICAIFLGFKYNKTFVLCFLVLPYSYREGPPSCSFLSFSITTAAMILKFFYFLFISISYVFA